MSGMPSDRSVQLIESTPAADPAPLGLAGFALATFLLSGHNASWIPDLIRVGPAIFYGGLAQFAAGMWEFMRSPGSCSRSPSSTPTCSSAACR